MMLNMCHNPDSGFQLWIYEGERPLVILMGCVGANGSDRRDGASLERDLKTTSDVLKMNF